MGHLDEFIESMKNSDVIWDKIGADMARKAKEEKTFYNSDKFRELTSIIKNEGVIHQEDFKYNKYSVPGLTYKDFTKFCNIAHTQNINKVKFNKQNGLYELVLDGLKIGLLVGQGSTYITERID